MLPLVGVNPADYARELREKWDALKQATLALKAVKDRPAHDLERLDSFSRYRAASESYEELLKKQVLD